MSGARSALIVATYAYDDERLSRLRAPERDAEALAEVLADPMIGGFDVTTVTNRPWHEVSRAVAQFFRDRRSEDLVLLHFSCHGLKDDSGELYFAATDTSLDLLEATAVSSASVSRAMDRSRAGRVVLLLDCCYSGAFARGMTAKAAGTVDVNERLGGRGRAVITASSALQFAFEGDAMADGDVDAASPSLFTSAVVRGLRTGEADRDLDGWVSLDELYTYVHDEVTRANPDQTPHKWAFDIAGDVQVARRGAPVTTPADLPAPVLESIASLYSWERAGAVEPLTEMLRGGHPGRALAARQALERMARHDDSDRVKAVAREALASVPAEVDVAEAPADRTPGPAGTPTVEPPATPTTEPSAEPPGPPDVPAEEGSRPPTVALPRQVASPPPPQADSRRPGPAWSLRSRRTAAAVLGAAAVAVVVLGSWVLTRGGTTDDAAGSTGTSGTSGGSSASGDAISRLPESAVVFTQTNGGDPQLVWLDTTGSGSTVALVDEPNAQRPTINPARTEVAYLRTNGVNPGTPYVVEVDGTGDRPLLTGKAAASCSASARPAWSPDGAWLAMVCYSGSDPTGLWVANSAGTRIARLPGTDSAAYAPTWGGDDKIYFLATGSAPGDAEVYEVTAGHPGVDGVIRDVRTDPTRVTDGTGTVSGPDWGPAGLLYLRSPSTNQPGDIYLTSGGHTTRLTTSDDVQSPAWSPDGTAVAWLAPRVQDSPVPLIWVAKLITTSGTPRLGPAHQVAMSGSPGTALAWGSR